MTSASSQNLSRSPSATGLAWLIIAGAVLFFVMQGWENLFDRLTTDDTMRLVQVRDFLNGQSWFDVIQHRLDIPNTTPMHWSRLVDVPIAGLIIFFDLFTDRQTAEKLALTLWPLLLLVPTVFGLLAIVKELVAPEVQKLALLLFATSLGIMSAYFSVGAIDHHNVQIALILWMTAGILNIHKAQTYAVCAGLTAALSLAVGPETTPLVMAGCLAVVVIWLFSDYRVERSVRTFGATFALGTLVCFVLTVPPRAYAVTFCDSLTLAQTSVALVGGLGLAGLTFFASANRIFKGIAIGVVGLVAIGCGISLAPQCLAPPLANLAPEVKSLWLDNVIEAQSFLAVVRSNLPLLIQSYVLPFLALGITIWMCASAPRTQKLQWYAFLLILTAAVAITIWQVRGIMTSLILAVPPITALARTLGKDIQAQDWEWVTPKALVFVLLANSFAMLLLSIPAWKLQNYKKPPAVATANAAPQSICNFPASYRPLQHVPVGFVANTIDMGPFLLAWTPQNVLVGPYHRHARALADSLAIFRSPPEKSEEIIRQRGIAYVVWCRESNDNAIYIDPEKQGLLARLVADRVPAWLEPIPLNGTPVRMYRVLPEPSASSSPSFEKR